MKEDSMTVAELRDALGVNEEQGYDAPFSTFTWKRWQEMQSEILFGLSCLQRAVSEQQPLTAALIALEMQQIAVEMQKEACSLIDVKPLC